MIDKNVDGATLRDAAADLDAFRDGTEGGVNVRVRRSGLHDRMHQSRVGQRAEIGDASLPNARVIIAG